VFARDRLTFVSAHALLRHALSLYEDVPAGAWAFAQNEFGKPRLADRHRGIDIGFNLAHTHGLVACVVCRGTDVGIDVESMNPRIHSLDLATRYFSPTEVSGLQACAEHDRAARFIELWTLKEAYVKAIGTGLSHPLDTFSFVLHGSSSLRFEPPIGDQRPVWQFALFAPSELHRMAVAIGGGANERRRITTWGGDIAGSASPIRRTAVHDA
jgi:4'-phosphopantetheinyl transferase